MALEAEFPSPVNPPPGCAFHPRCPNATDVCSRVDPPPTGTAHVYRCHNPDNIPAEA